MSKLSDQFRALHIVNAYDLLRKFGVKGKTDICVSYRPRPSGRMGICEINKTTVYSPSHKTNPDAHWTDRGCKTFIGNRSESMPAALDWTTKRYGISEWAPSPIDGADKVPASVRKAALQFLKDSKP